MLKRADGPRVAGLIVFAAALWAQHDGLVGVFFDDGVYVALARALASGEGYVNGHLPGVVPGVHYPPLYPWALSLLWRAWPAFPANVVLFQLFDAACLGLAAWIIAAHARRLPLGPWTRVPLVVAGLVAFPVLALVGVRFSEPLFLALAAGALAVAARTGGSWRLALAAGGLAGLATLTRSIGVAMILGIVGAYALRGRWRHAGAAALGAGLLVAPWFVWTLRQAPRVPDVLAANYGTYGRELLQAGPGGVITPAALAVPRPFLSLVLPPVPPIAWYPLAAVVLGLLVWGAVRAFRDVPALVIALGAYVGITALWPYAPDRFIWIVLPWLFLMLAVGIQAVGRTGGRAVRVGISLIVVLMVGTGIAREWSSLSTRRFTESAQLISAPMRLLTAVLNAEVPPGTIAGADEALLSLYTGRRAVPAHLFTWEGRGTRDLTVEETRAALCGLGVAYVVSTGPGDRAEALVEGLPAHFRLRNGPGIWRLSCE